MCFIQLCLMDIVISSGKGGSGVVCHHGMNRNNRFLAKNEDAVFIRLSCE